ncbi:MAG: hypothetical protein M3081_12795 [Gemmatimonadota bacterium]|nr:hypothetical protein [Gemmatimonadota bacterium]
MIMADVFKILFLILGTLIVFVSYWLAATALFPRAVSSARAQYDLHAFRITLVGALVGVPVFALGLLLVTQAPTPLLKLAGGALLAVPILLGLLGSAGLSERIGVGMPSLVDEHQPWRRVMRGGVVLSLTFLLPVVGWFVVLPWTVLSGFGAAVSSMAAATRRPRPA